MLGAVALSRMLHSFLFEVSSLDPVTYCAVPLLMLVVALTAAWIPARRAAAVDPMVALRGRVSSDVRILHFGFERSQPFASNHPTDVDLSVGAPVPARAAMKTDPIVALRCE